MFSRQIIIILIILGFILVNLAKINFATQFHPTNNSHYETARVLINRLNRVFLKFFSNLNKNPQMRKFLNEKYLADSKFFEKILMNMLEKIINKRIRQLSKYLILRQG